MIEIQQQSLFDYNSLDEPTRLFVQEKAQDIHSRLKRTAEDIIAIGRDLIEVKAQLQYGQFIPWLQSEFDMTARSAQRFMQVAERFGIRNDNLSFLPISVLYELASPSTPDDVIEMVDTGQIPATIPAIREAKRETHEEGYTERVSLADVFDPVGHSIPPSLLPPGFGLVDGKPFDMPLPDGKPVEIPEEWKLPREMRIAPNPIVDEAKEKRDTHVMQVMGSSESPEWYTPWEIINLTISLFDEIDLDPCSNSHETPNIPARNHYTKEDNGLFQPWSGKVYLNPPYGSEIPQWVNKLVKAYDDKQVEEAIALLPARIDTQWFQPLYDFLMCNVRGRVQYENSPYSAPFPCVIVYLGKRVEDFIKVFQHKGPIMRRIG